MSTISSASRSTVTARFLLKSSTLDSSLETGMEISISKKKEKRHQKAGSDGFKDFIRFPRGKKKEEKYRQ